MTIEQYKNNYYNFKASRIGQYDDLDQQYGFQCFDLVNRYNFYVLNLGWTLNELYYNLNTQGIYKEVGIGYMLPGDICIWQGEHICIFDSWDATNNVLYFLSQDSNARPTGVYSVVTNSRQPMRAFRPLYVEDTPKPIEVPKEEEKPIETPVEPPKEEPIEVIEDKPIDVVEPIKTSILDIILNLIKKIIEIIFKKGENK